MIKPTKKPSAGWFIVVSLVLVVGLLVPGCGEMPATDFHQWRIYGGDKGGTRYSALDEINRSNVHQLQAAWIYHTGDKRDKPLSTIECNPIVVDDTMYVTSPSLKVTALQAASGVAIWTFDPFEGQEIFGVNRGVTYWEKGGDRRILFSAGPHLYALNAGTGQLIADFGESGRVDLRKGLDRDIDGARMTVSTPGIIYKDLLILGSSLGEGPQPAAPGHIRAYDVRSGERAWIFHTIPHPGEYGYDTWPQDAWQRVGGANSWGGLSVDEERGMVFLGTGSATFDFYGGDRHGQNLFANSVVALKALTGERVWHFQTVHHDIWDYDIPTQPNLVTVNHGGQLIDAVAQVTKMGLVFVLDRETGKPLFPVEERPVPPSKLEGEATWPTQPFPLKPPPFTRHTFTEAEATDISSESRAYILERLEQLGSSKIYLPPSERGTIVFPGYHGGADWGGAAFDPSTGRLYINANEIPMVATMERLVPDTVSSLALSAGEAIYQENCISCHGQGGENQPSVYSSLDVIRKHLTKPQLIQLLAEGRGDMVPFIHLKGAQIDALYAFLSGLRRFSDMSEQKSAYPYPYVFGGYQRFVDLEGFPAVKPPWGTLSALDLNHGERIWQIPLGEIDELVARGLPPTGTENFGGPIVTAGGLVFIGASKDDKFRAFDKETGNLLWETTLPASGTATPTTYQVNGKQYVVIAAGGGRGRRGREREDRKAGDAYVAFALPE